MAHKVSSQLTRYTAEAGATVLDVNEAYTTQTVSWTGEVLEGLVVCQWWLTGTASEWIVTTMERVGYTCARWEISVFRICPNLR